MTYAKKPGRVSGMDQAVLNMPGNTTDYYKVRKIAEEAGLEFVPLSKKKKRTKHSPEKLLSHLIAVALKLGYTPSESEIYEKGKYTHNMFTYCFGSMRNAQQLAGLKPNTQYNTVENISRHSNYVTREHCVEDIKRIYIELGCLPTLAQLKKHGKYTYCIYYTRLGGIKKIKELPELKKQA
jgi:hypothetical protein